MVKGQHAVDRQNDSQLADTITLTTCTFYTTYYHLNPHKKETGAIIRNKSFSLVVKQQHWFCAENSLWLSHNAGHVMNWPVWLQWDVPETAGPEGWAEITATVCVSSRAVLNDTALEYLCCLQPRTHFCFRGGLEKLDQWHHQRFYSLVCLFGKGWHSLRIGQSRQIEKIHNFAASAVLCGSELMFCRHLAIKRKTATLSSGVERKRPAECGIVKQTERSGRFIQVGVK